MRAISTPGSTPWISRVTLVLHDWGSGFGFHWARRHPDRVAGIAFMEALVKPLSWEDLSNDACEVVRSARTPGVAERMILEENAFVESVLPGSVLRTEAIGTAFGECWSS
jgi:haloalkane dehalogenase